jgi:hypothetical protein
LTYQVLTARRVREQLDGVVAFLRVDPAAASVAFVPLGGPDFKTIIFAQGRGFLRYHIFEEHRVVVLVHLT